MTPRISEVKIKAVAQEIGERFKPDKIILFGSYAWGTPGADSDVDFFVIKKTENTRQLAREIDGSIFPRPFPLDLIVYEPQQVRRRAARGDAFIKNILTRGRILYER